MPKKSFNVGHPEIKEGEVFLTNVGENRDFGMSLSLHDDGFAGIGWKTKRRGTVAYDIYGKPVSGMKPVFVQRDELKKGGIDPDNLFTGHLDHEEKKIPFARFILGAGVVLVVLVAIAFAIFAR